jgi:ArsR family transcriptional regulator
MDSTDVKYFFEQVAGDWDTMRLDYFDERVIDQLADHTDLDTTKTVVDVGTGTAFVAAGLASRAERVLAFDLSPAMLKVAAGNLAALNIETSSWARPTSPASPWTTTRSTPPSPTWCSTTPRTPAA